MISIGRIGNSLGKFFEGIAIARVNSVLLGMDRDRLAEMGYSYELLRRGPKAWPWREPNQDGAPQTENTTRAGALPGVHAGHSSPIARPSSVDESRSGFDIGRDAA